MRIFQRLIIGALIGLVTTWGVVLASSLAGAGAGLSGFGGGAGLWLTGAFMGLSYAWLFQPVRGGHGENLMSGLVFGMISWVVLALGVYPVLAGDGPLWQARAAAAQFPLLIAYSLQGSFISFAYGLAHELLLRVDVIEPKPSKAAPPSITKRVVIIGGGYAGVRAAQKLEEELENDPTVGIWLVSKANYFTFTPMLSEVAASAVEPQHISPALRSFFRNVQVVHGLVERIDLDQRVVYLAADSRPPYRELPFDHVVLATGSVPNFFENQDIASQAFTFKTLADAEILRNHMIDMFERADLEQDPDKRRRMLTFVVAGGGFAGVELVGAMNDFARGMLLYYPNVPPEEIKLILVHSRETILPELSQSLGESAREKLQQRGVEFKLGIRVNGVEPGLIYLEDETISAETLVWTAGNKANPVLESLGLPLTTPGQLEVDEKLAVPGEFGVWAAGDCASVPDLVTGDVAPHTAQHAVQQGRTLGYNIAATIKGNPLKTYRHKTRGSLAILGHQLAVAEIFGRCFSGFLAWLMWRAIYLIKLPTLDKRVRVGLDWLLDIFFPPDVVQTVEFNSSPEEAGVGAERTSSRQKPAEAEQSFERNGTEPHPIQETREVVGEG